MVDYDLAKQGGTYSWSRRRNRLSHRDCIRQREWHVVCLDRDTPSLEKTVIVLNLSSFQ